MNFRSLLRALMGLGKPTPAQVRQAERVLKQAGYRVEPPRTAPGGPLVIPPRRGFPIRGLPATPQTAPPERQVDELTEAMLTGREFKVHSSNVYSIAFVMADESAKSGDLYVRYLAQHAEGQRAGPGSLYKYSPVTPDMFREFVRASSKGTWVWDELRQRGTVAGFKVPYELVGVVEQFVGGRSVQNYVPRAATILRGQPGQHFVKRNFKLGEIRGGRLQFRTVGSQLKPAQASQRGPNPERGPGVNRMQLMPGRGP